MWVHSQDLMLCCPYLCYTCRNEHKKGGFVRMGSGGFPVRWFAHLIPFTQSVQPEETELHRPCESSLNQYFSRISLESLLNRMDDWMTFFFHTFVLAHFQQCIYIVSDYICFTCFRADIHKHALHTIIVIVKSKDWLTGCHFQATKHSKCTLTPYSSFLNLLQGTDAPISSLLWKCWRLRRNPSILFSHAWF